MVLAGTRWLGIRLDLLSALLVGAVALTAALYSHDSGKLFFVLLVTSVQIRQEGRFTKGLHALIF